MEQKLELLKQIAHGISMQFGQDCEVVIHDCRHGLENTIVHIENGHITRRHSGDGASNIVLKAQRTVPEQLQDQYSYLTKTEDGRLMKSTTLYIRDDDGSIAYIFSINYDITALTAAEQFIQTMITTNDELTKSKQSMETSAPKITHNVSELLDTLIDQALSSISKPVAMMSKDDKIKVVQSLNDAGAFLITKSGDKVASILGISKFTLYNYMDSGK